jgi:hypothetical protein
MAVGRRTRDRLGANRGGLGHQLADQFDLLSHQAFDLSQLASGMSMRRRFAVDQATITG